MSTQIDILGSVAKSYVFAFENVQTWWRWAIIPFALTLITSIMGHLYGLSEKPFWYAIASLPELFFRGWLAVKFVRFFLLKEIGPVPNKKSDLSDLTAGILLFVFIGYTITALFGYLLTFDLEELAQRQDPVIGAVMLCGLAAMLWAVRYLWVYVPAAVGYPIRGFLKKLKGWMSSAQIICIIIAAYIPIYTVLFFIISMLESSGVSFKEFNGSPAILLITLSVFADIIISAVISFAAAHVVRDLTSGDSQNQGEGS